MMSSFCHMSSPAAFLLLQQLQRFQRLFGMKWPSSAFTGHWFFGRLTELLPLENTSEVGDELHRTKKDISLTEKGSVWHVSEVAIH